LITNLHTAQTSAAQLLHVEHSDSIIVLRPLSGTTAWRQREAHSLRSARRRKRRVVVTPDNRDKMPANQPARPNLSRLRGCRRLGKLGLPPKRGEVAVTDIPADVAGSARPSRRLRCARVARLLGFIALCDGGMRDGYPDVEPPTVQRRCEPMSYCDA
jgi:hypothetical protein